LQTDELGRADLAVGGHFGFERGATRNRRRLDFRQIIAPREIEADNRADHHDGAGADNNLLVSGQSHISN
jgi:hypothetical protein